MNRMKNSDLPLEYNYSEVSDEKKIPVFVNK